MDPLTILLWGIVVLLFSPLFLALTAVSFLLIFLLLFVVFLIVLIILGICSVPTLLFLLKAFDKKNRLAEWWIERRLRKATKLETA